MSSPSDGSSIVNSSNSTWKLVTLYIVVVVVVGSSGVGYTFATFTDRESASVSMTTAANFPTQTAGNTPTATAGNTPTATPTPRHGINAESNAATPQPEKHAFSFAAFCTDASDATASDVTVTPTLHKIDEPDEVLVFEWNSTVDIEHIVPKAGPDITVHLDLITPTEGLIVVGEGKESFRPRSPSNPCPSTATSIKIEFDEEDQEDENEDNKEQKEEEENNSGPPEQANPRGPPGERSRAPPNEGRNP